VTLIDDILINSKDRDEYTAWQTLEEHRLYKKLKKCEFGYKKLSFGDMQFQSR